MPQVKCWPFCSGLNELKSMSKPKDHASALTSFCLSHSFINVYVDFPSKSSECSNYLPINNWLNYFYCCYTQLCIPQLKVAFTDPFNKSIQIIHRINLAQWVKPTVIYQAMVMRHWWLVCQPPISQRIYELIIQIFGIYCQVSNIRRTKSPHLKDSRTVLRLSLPNPLKPDVKSRMKM